MSPFAKDLLVGVGIVISVLWLLGYGASIATRWIAKDDPEWKGRGE